MGWDEAALEVGSWSRDRFGAELDKATRIDKDKLLRLRLRWHIDEFGELIVRPLVERSGFTWFPNSPVNTELLSWKPTRFSDRSARTAQHLVWAPRGSAKTTTLKERTLHALVYGLEAGFVVIAAGDTAAASFINTIWSWAQNPPTMMARLWPSFRVTGSDEMRIARIAGRQPVALHARGWLSTQIRGLNNELARPTTAILDDIESDATTSSEAVRDKAQEKLLTQVMGLLPMEGGGQVWWSATPVHHDCCSARAVARKPGLRGWSVVRHRAVIRWPDRSDLWDACREVFFDFDTYPDEDAREAAAKAYYEAHRAEMDAGAEVLDPYRLPIFAAYLKRWSMGDTAFWREYQTEPRARTTSHFDTSKWRRFRWAPDRKLLSTSGKTLIRLDSLVRRAHWDPSDGGDPGAVAIGARDPVSKRVLMLHVRIMTQTRKTVQIPIVVAACREYGVTLLQYESNSLDSTGVDALRAHIKATGGGISIVPLHTSENKETRLGGFEVPAMQGRVEFAEDIDEAVLAQCDDWNPKKTNNVDDALDAMQRLYELCAEHRRPGMAGG